MTKKLKTEIAAISVEEIILRAKHYILDSFRMWRFLHQSRVAVAGRYANWFRMQRGADTYRKQIEVNRAMSKAADGFALKSKRHGNAFKTGEC